jgi:ABC-type amino acid transport substrate-binding protein
VRADLKDAIKSLGDLAGKTVCVGESTTYETYLNGKADFEVITPAPKDVKVGVVKTDAECLQSMQSGRKDYDAVLTAGNVIADGIKKGAPVVLLGKAVYAEKLGFSIDKNAAPNGKFLEQLNKAVADMHSDGTLTALSKKYYDGFDLTVVEK